jgi:hypothetical protein
MCLSLSKTWFGVRIVCNNLSDVEWMKSNVIDQLNPESLSVVNNEPDNYIENPKPLDIGHTTST